MQSRFLKTMAAMLSTLLVFLIALLLARGIYTNTASSDPGYEIIVDGLETAAEEVAELSLSDALMGANPADGERVFRQCAACHVQEPGVHKVGPSLHLIVGREIASAEGFDYSEALLALPGAWSFAALNAYLENPKRYAPGTTMGFNGLRRVEDRAALLLYLAGRDAPLPQPVIGPTSPTTPQADPLLALMEAQLKSADLAFNRPDTMQLGRATSVELVLAPDTAPRAPVAEGATDQEVAESIGLSSDLSGTTQVVEDVTYALQMEAEIAGLGFDVQPPGPQRQTVLPGQSAKWVWTIEPKVGGSDRVFTVNVNAIIQRDDKDLPPVRITTFTERITVEVSLMQDILRRAEELTTLNAAIAGIGGTLVAVLGWLWARMRKQKKPEPPKPTEVVITHKFGEGD